MLMLIPFCRYLQEIGYTDTIIDIRSNRVRSLLDFQDDEDEDEDEQNSNNNARNCDPEMAIDSGKKSTAPGGRSPGCGTERNKSPNNKEMLLESEAAVLANFDFLSQEGDGVDEDEDMNDEGDVMCIGKQKLHLDQTDKSSANEVSGDNFELGELSRLTINNDNETVFNQAWSARYALRSHFDGVRAVGFHPTEPVLVTASEDHTLKLWNLQKTLPAKRSSVLDVEPLFTFRAHEGHVLSLAVSSSGDFIFSGGLDGNVLTWNMPNTNVDPYDSYGNLEDVVELNFPVSMIIFFSLWFQILIYWLRH